MNEEFIKNRNEWRRYRNCTVGMNRECEQDEIPEAVLEKCNECEDECEVVI